jgi:hypothetical protein
MSSEYAIAWDDNVPDVTDELARWIWNESGTEKVTRERTDGATITYPGRNNALASLAGSMRRRGMTQPEIEAALVTINVTRVQPPLDDEDVRRIAHSVSRYEVADDVLKLVERGQRDPVYGDETNPAYTITTQTVKEICELPQQGYDQLLGPLVYRGLRTLVGAATGEGKTTLVMWMIRAIVEGEGFLGYSGIGPDDEGKKPVILIIDAEQSVPDIQRLAHETGMGGSEQIHYISVPDGLHLGESTTDALQVERIIEQLRPDVLIVDPAYKVAAIDSNNEREVVDLMRLFDRWRAEYGFAFVMPVHTRKGDKKNPGGQPTLDDIFGSGAFSRGAEVILGLRQGEPGWSRLYVWKHRPGELNKNTQIDMAFDRDKGFSRIHKETVQTVQQMVESLLAQNPMGLSTTELAHRTNKSSESIRKVISQSGSRIVGQQVPGSRNRKVYTLSEAALIEDDELMQYEQRAHWEDKIDG